jgi:DNA-binding NtrC family response regulator
MGYGLGRETVENKAAIRSVVLASADAEFRGRLRGQLAAMRWRVREAGGGAEAMAQLEAEGAEAMVLDSVLPDLEVGEFARQMRSRHPVMDLLCVDAGADETGSHSPRRNELLHALRQAQEGGGGGTAWAIAPVDLPKSSADDRLTFAERCTVAVLDAEPTCIVEEPVRVARVHILPLPEMVGESPAMLELARMVRLVAPRSTTVLIEGDTGTGKELVAKAVHSLSTRAGKPFLVLNCAAIPEALLEAELFGHTRGAFTGAVQSRQGRIEAANGGTLFLDEIGEMALGLQAKLLRFLESGELQRVGDNETIRVDVRVVAASHQPLQQRATDGAFRLDLYHRLAVFPVWLPALRERMSDVPALAEYLLDRLGEEMPVKRLSVGAAQRLMEHPWPGNVRELAHVLERGAILAEDRREIAREEIRF